MRKKVARIAGPILCLVCIAAAGPVLADHDEGVGGDHREGHRERDGGKPGKRGAKASIVTDGAYIDACGQCHFAFQPFLLPSASWDRILANPEDHFGQDLGLSAEEIGTIRKYLDANAADRSELKLSRRIVKSLSGKTVLRITQVPYIVSAHKDDDIPADASRRKAVGSMANCSACHIGAERGIYDDDSVRIPD